MSDAPAAFFDFPEQAFPFQISVLDEESLELLWQVLVSGPGALHVPSFAPRKVTVIMKATDGSHCITDSSGQSFALPPAAPDGDQHGQ